MRRERAVGPLPRPQFAEKNYRTPSAPARPLRRAFASTLATEAVLLAFGLVTGALTARLLGPAGRGELALVLIWPQLLATIGLCSIPEATTYTIGGRTGAISRLVPSALLLASGMAVLTVSAGYLLLPYLIEGEAAWLVGLAREYLALYVPIYFLSAILLGADHGNRRFDRYNFHRALLPPTYLAGLGILWLLDRFTVPYVVGVTVGAPALLTVVRVVAHRRALSRMPSKARIGDLARLAIRFHPSALLILASTQIDRLFVLAQWPPESVGSYVVAATIATAGITTVSTAFNRVVYPHLSRLRGTEDQAALLARSIRVLTLLLCVSGVVLSLAMPLLLPALAGASFRSAVSVAQMLVLAYVAASLKEFTIVSLRACGDASAGMYAAALSVAVYIPLAYAMVRVAGTSGVALALALSNVLAILYLLRALRRRGLMLHPGELWGLNPATARDACGVLRGVMFGR